MSEISQMRWGGFGALVISLLALSRGALAADLVQECISRHVEGQSFRNEGYLKAAQIEFAQCSSAECPALLREECIKLLGEVGSALPSIVLGAIDETGSPTSAARVTVDGSPELLPLDGRIITLDPGHHSLRFERADGATWEVSVSLMEFEHNRRVAADFRMPPTYQAHSLPSRDTHPDSSEVSRVPVMVVSSGVALAALGSFTYFALSGRSVAKELDRCKPNCEDRSELDRLRSRYLFADVSLGVALVSIGVGAYAWLTTPSSASPNSSQHAWTNQLCLQPVASHGRVGIWARGVF